MTIKLIVGLANPGKEYESTRHNAGAWYVDALCDEFNITLKKEAKLFAMLGSDTISGQSVRFAVPSTYMNESGKPCQSIANYFKISPENILIAHDELDLPVGTVKLKFGGGHGGHNGLRDIIALLGTNKFHRLRIGIGHPGNKNQVTNYVLKPPSQDDRISIDDAIRGAVNETETIITGKMEQAMTSLHTSS